MSRETISQNNFTEEFMEKQQTKIFLRMSDVTAILGLSRSTVNRLMIDDSTFPKRVKLTPQGRAVGFSYDDVLQWANNRRNETDGEERND